MQQRIAVMLVLPEYSQHSKCNYIQRSSTQRAV